MLTVITDLDNIRHIIWLSNKFNPFIVTKCNLTVVMIGGKCPDTPEHLIALPSCPKHTIPIKCGTCYAPSST